MGANDLYAAKLAAQLAHAREIKCFEIGDHDVCAMLGYGEAQLILRLRQVNFLAMRLQSGGEFGGRNTIALRDDGGGTLRHNYPQETGLKPVWLRDYLRPSAVSYGTASSLPFCCFSRISTLPSASSSSLRQELE